MTSLIKWIDTHYNHPPIIVTENGLGTGPQSTNDTNRIERIQVNCL